LLTTEEVRGTTGVYKYVQVEGGEFRFVELTAAPPNIKKLLSEGERAVSAGAIAVTDKHFRYLDYGSYSLGIGKEDDQAKLEHALARPGKHLDGP
jgi:hypothetical protein